jgi:hypothetical protein
MRIIILDTDHELQCHDQALKDLIAEIVSHEQVTFVGEENRPMLNTIARQVSDSIGLRWIQIDMSIQDRIKSGIDGKLQNRMQVRYDDSGNPTLAMLPSRTESENNSGWIELRKSPIMRSV